MSIIKYLIILIFFTILNNQSIAEEVKKIGKFKDWQTMVIKVDIQVVRCALHSLHLCYKLQSQIKEKLDYL